MTSADSSGPGRPKSLIATFYRDAARDLSQATEEDGKFVVLTKGRSVHLVLSPLSLTPYHANIVYEYLQVGGRGDVEAVSSGGCRIVTRGWKVHGGGHYTVQHWLHNLILHGKSTAFGKYDQKLLGRLADGIAPGLGLDGFTVEFK